MQGTALRLVTWHPVKAALMGLTLITSAVHFFDNAIRPDLYPGPAWLTGNIVLAAWFVILIAAYVAYLIDTRTALIAYGLLGFAGLSHWFVSHPGTMPFRCVATIDAEAFASVLLITYALLRPRSN